MRRISPAQGNRKYNGVYGRQRVFCEKVPQALSLCLYELVKECCRTHQAKLSMLATEAWALRRPIDERECWKLAYARLRTGHERGSVGTVARLNPLS